MVLQPVNDSAGRLPQTGRLGVWDAIQPTQLQPAAEYWLITQPDHAALAGDLAASFVSPQFPRPDDEVIQAIAIHDAGWAIFEPERNPAAAPCLLPGGKPQSFLEVAPEDFVRAWRACVDTAEKLTPGAALMVSGHFRRLAEYRLRLEADTPQDIFLLRDFVKSEERRKQSLQELQRRSEAEVEGLVDLLQFCDLVSLYLCCGSEAEVEFPQRFGGRPVCARRRGEVVEFEPSPFRAEERDRSGGVSLGVRASRYPRSNESSNTRIVPLLLW